MDISRCRGGGGGGYRWPRPSCEVGRRAAYVLSLSRLPVCVCVPEPATAVRSAEHSIHRPTTQCVWRELAGDTP